MKPLGFGEHAKGSQNVQFGVGNLCHADAQALSYNWAIVIRAINFCDGHTISCEARLAKISDNERMNCSVCRSIFSYSVIILYIHPKKPS